MSKLFSLPVELLQLIGDHLESQSDINIFIRTCKHLHSVLNGYLYRYNSINHRRSALFWAAERDIPETAAHSIKAAPYTEIRNMAGMTPLIIAVQKGHLSTVKQLLEYVDRGINLEERNDDRRTPLAFAACFGQAETAKLLIEKGANIESKDEGQKTPLILAAVNGYPDVVKLLLDHGAAVHEKDEYGRTALAWAADIGKLVAVDHLLENGALVDARTINDSTPLMIAAANGRDTVVKRLLEGGADPNARSGNGWTVLHYAANFDPKESVVRQLLAAGSDPKATISSARYPNRTPADVAYRYPHNRPESEVVYNILLEAAGGGQSDDAGSR
ncbi:ankyrin repeat-containing domain protein [Aspergillus stella-maris]|uniref:ankyrin repeat-containing domain protein n=1 Tax=Aspergillus stella-maris TaxID=1810926 RepID=UPI003CCDC52D